MPLPFTRGTISALAYGLFGGKTVTASYLVVAGGGAGGGPAGGGGGAGGYLTGTATLNATLSYTVIVGAGAASQSGINGGVLGNGSNSQFGIIATSIGGGGGGSGTNPYQNGASGGSGGGAGANNSPTGGAGTAGQGNAGGNGNSSSPFPSGGGGGAGAAGGAASGSQSGAGGVGLSSSISGVSTFYAGGGGGAGTTQGAAAGSGGNGGGGAGSVNSGNPGAANTGGGGGGAGNSGSNSSGQGGSGIVIISYTGPQQFGGGVVTSSGGNTIHTFTTSGTLSPLNSLTASYLIVAGGGGGGADSAGGGGAGGLLSGSSLTIDTNSVYVVTVGAGGSGGPASGNAGSNGSNSTFSSIVTSTGGGGGGGRNTNNAASGGSGGGGAGDSTNTLRTGAAGTSGQGNAGGNGFAANNPNAIAGGGGGGAGAVGSAGISNGTGGNGGNGVASSISGSSVTYAGGGGGGEGLGTSSASGGTGGTGGGGNGASTSTSGSIGFSGTANLGGGGGGGGRIAAPGSGGAGGSGIVIISYPGSAAQMAGGTITVAGGNVIHTFTSSGFLTPITNVNNSLRFRSSVAAYLSRTPTVAGNRQTWTWSAWIKRGILGGASNVLFNCYNTTSATQTSIEFGNDIFGIFSNDSSTVNVNLFTTQVFRDPSAWYHLVVSFDTTQATASNRVRIFVNGTQVTAFSSSTYPAQNYSGHINSTSLTTIGATRSPSGLTDGYLADVNFIDGQALTPNAFGTLNDLGVWQPIRYGGSYGTNGFYLPFTGNSSFYGSFNGSNQSLQATLPATLTGAFTIEFYLYRNGTGNQFCFTLGDSNTSTGLEYYIGSTGTVNNVYSSSAQISTSANVPVANAWNHVAITRDSSNVVRLFVNGVQTGGTWTTSAAFSSTLRIGVEFFNNAITGYVNGGLSNFRIVNGTALYTNTFAPSTSPLTAVAGTSILTLQSSTIIDNSSNALSITNNNSVTTSQAYPFTMLANQTRDYSPNGNNWTNNNIGVLAGTTLDIMTDVPTNTSATAANYAVLNPLNNSGGITISDGNLRALWASASDRSVLSTFPIPSSGKFYAEFVVGTLTSSNVAASFGLATEGSSRTGIVAANMWVYYASNQSFIVRNGTFSSQIGSNQTFAAGGIVQVAVDRDNNQAWLGYNNVWVNSTNGTDGNPSAGTNPTVSSLPVDLFILVGLYANSGNINFGQQPFVYTPPTGFVALNTFNLPTPTIGATAATQANKYFDATTYTGNGTSQSITNSGSMQPDFVWLKARSQAWNHLLFDSIRGTTKYLTSNSTVAETTNTGTLTAFNSNGFSVSFDAEANGNTQSFVGWQWRASNAAGVTNTAGSITSTVSANTTAGFSIVTYTGNNTSGSTVGHGLGVVPAMVICKNRTTGIGSGAWPVWHKSLSSGSHYLFLNTTAAQANGNNNFTATPTSTVLNLGTSDTNNTATMVAYCFAEVAGYSRFGSYTGNGSTDGPFVFCGFRPRFIMIKRTDSAANWRILDTARDTYNVEQYELYPNLANAEGTFSSLDGLSNGFKIRNSDSAYNANGGTYIYAAFAEEPFKYANAR